MTEMASDNFELLQLNASGLILTSQKKITIKDKLNSISSKVYDKSYREEYYFNKENTFGIITFEIKKSSSWNISYDNVIYHYIFIYQNTYICKDLATKNYVFVGFSDSSKHKKIFSKLNESSPKLNKLDKNELKRAFLSKYIHTMWMKNHSKKTVFKPDNKILVGNIASILNPIMDSSFSFTSAKGNMNNDKIIINPSLSKFFLKKSNSIDNLQSLFQNIIDYINTIDKEMKFEFDYLLEEEKDINFAKSFDKLVDFSFQSPDWLNSFNFFNDDLNYEDYSYLIENLIFEITNPPKVKPSNIPNKYFASLSVSYEEITFTVNFYQLIRGVYSCSFVGFEKLKKRYPDEYMSIYYIFRSSSLQKFYFNNGYMIDGEQVFQNRYQNINYNKDKIFTNQFEKTNIEKEKPTLKNKKDFDSTKIGDDDSLFCWTVNNWKHELLRENDTVHSEFLICDDGSNEVADFIHLVELDNNHFILNIIHIKAAKRTKKSSKPRKRQVSVGAFDIVLTQAIKNARYTEISELHKKLNTTPEKIDKVWENNILNKSLKRIDFIKKLENIDNKGLNYETNIIVMQPHLSYDTYEKLGNNKNTKKLLNTLLHSSNNAISGFSSSLSIFISE